MPNQPDSVFRKGNLSVLTHVFAGKKPQTLGTYAPSLKLWKRQRPRHGLTESRDINCICGKTLFLARVACPHCHERTLAPVGYSPIEGFQSLDMPNQPDSVFRQGNLSALVHVFAGKKPQTLVTYAPSLKRWKRRRPRCRSKESRDFECTYPPVVMCLLDINIAQPNEIPARGPG